MAVSRISRMPQVTARELIVQSREGVARAVDAGLTTLYWHVGQRIRQDILKEKRAGYGDQIVSALRTQLGWTHFLRLIPINDPLKRDSLTYSSIIEDSVA